MYRFENPVFLALVVPLFLIFLVRGKNQGYVYYSKVDELKDFFTSFNPQVILRFLRFLALLFLVLALARPQSGRVETEVDSAGVDIVLAMDTSGSMKGLDLSENEDRTRLDIVKEMAREFILKRSHDRIGLVVFGEEAFTQSPLTHDQGMLLGFLKEMWIGMAGEQTAIGSALGISVKRLKDIESKSKIVILLTDGRSNSGILPPLEAAKLASTYGIKVYTVGAGTRGRAAYEVDSFFGKRKVYQNVDIDEDTLKEISSITGGRYFRATNQDELRKVYEEIDKMETTDAKIKEFSLYEEKYHFFLYLSLLILALELVLSETRLRVLP